MWRWGGVVLGVFLWVLVFVSACFRTQYKYHVVRSGETLSEIGYAYRIPYQELAALNYIRNPDRIESGQRLRVPHGALYHGPIETTATAKLPLPIRGKPPARWKPRPPPVHPPIPDDAGNVNVQVYNLQGQIVSTLLSGYQAADTYTLIWEAYQVPSGMYFVKAEAEGFTETQKLMLIK